MPIIKNRRAVILKGTGLDECIEHGKDSVNRRPQSFVELLSSTACLPFGQSHYTALFLQLGRALRGISIYHKLDWTRVRRRQ